jgi:hypothetical protein
MDFMRSRYRRFLDAFSEGGYAFMTVKEFFQGAPEGKTVVLRHDVDRCPGNALKLARIEKERRIASTFFFRTTKGVFRPGIIKEIAGLGHEIGYHYEDLAKARGDYARALSLFGKHLENLRRFYPVSTMCMHGSPFSRFDNRSLWEKYDYRKYGIIGEPYLDIDYSRVLYITDAGRRWNDDKANIRDRVEGMRTGRISSSRVTMSWIREKRLNETVLLNIHPDKWHGNVLSWTVDLVLQSLKNVVKESLLRMRIYGNPKDEKKD